MVADDLAMPTSEVINWYGTDLTHKDYTIAHMEWGNITLMSSEMSIMGSNVLDICLQRLHCTERTKGKNNLMFLIGNVLINIFLRLQKGISSGRGCAALNTLALLHSVLKMLIFVKYSTKNAKHIQESKESLN